MAKMRPSFKVGLIAGGLIFAQFMITLLFHLKGSMANLLQYSTFIFLLGGVYLGIHQQRKSNGGQIEFIAALRTGFTVAIICTFFIVLGLVVAFYSIPISEKIADLKAMGWSAERIEKELQRMNTVNVITGSFFGSLPMLLIGCLGTLGAAAILSKRPSQL